MKIERRIQKAERAVGIEGEPVNVPSITICMDWSTDETVPHFPEPVEGWVTRKAAFKQVEGTLLPRIFIADPWSEYEARHGLEPGTLTSHELRGKVPFTELLAAATGRMPDQGEQPCTAD